MPFEELYTCETTLRSRRSSHVVLFCSKFRGFFFIFPRLLLQYRRRKSGIPMPPRRNQCSETVFSGSCFIKLGAVLIHCGIHSVDTRWRERGRKMTLFHLTWCYCVCLLAFSSSLSLPGWWLGDDGAPVHLQGPLDLLLPRSLLLPCHGN